MQSFPSLPGQGWSVTRTAEFKTRKQVSISGKETSLADWSYPRYTWEVVFNLLRQGAFLGSTWTEFQQLMGFYNARSGGFDSFLYQDEDDYTVSAQPIAIGDGVTGSYAGPYFQLVRSFGGYTEPLNAVTNITTVYFNGSPVTNSGSTAWNWTTWGGSEGLTPFSAVNIPVGSLWFSVAPSSGVVITADLSYSFPCRFVEDLCAFEKFMAGCYAVKKLTFKSIK